MKRQLFILILLPLAIFAAIVAARLPATTVTAIAGAACIGVPLTIIALGLLAMVFHYRRQVKSQPPPREPRHLPQPNPPYIIMQPQTPQLQSWQPGGYSLPEPRNFAVIGDEFVEQDEYQK
jgi:hypothetical protein